MAGRSRLGHGVSTCNRSVAPRSTEMPESMGVYRPTASRVSSRYSASPSLTSGKHDLVHVLCRNLLRVTCVRDYKRQLQSQYGNENT